MPTIIATCPYCRAGGVRAPANAVGASATCPKCKSNYTVLPDDDPPEWATAARPDATSFSAGTSEKPKLPPPAEAPAAPAAAGGGAAPAEAGAGATTKRTADGEPAAKPQAASWGEPDESAPTDTATVFALLALILVGPAVLASQLPFGRAIALSLAGVGLLGGLLCLGAEGRARLMGAGAALAHAMVAGLVVFLPSWLHLDPWGADGAPAEDEQKRVAVAVEHGTGRAVPYSPAEWLDADRTSWQRGDARVTVRSAVGPVELHGPNGAKRATKEPYLQLTVQVANAGFGRELPLSGWAAGQGAEGVRVAAADGKELKPAAFEAGWSPDPGKPTPRAAPGHASEVVLVFAAPPPKTRSVRVQLPGAALGETDEIRFRLGAVGLLPAAGK